MILNIICIIINIICLIVFFVFKQGTAIELMAFLINVTILTLNSILLGYKIFNGSNENDT